MLEEKGVLENIAYRSARVICEYTKGRIFLKGNKKFQLFQEIARVLCPGYLANISPGTICIYLGFTKIEELQSAAETTNMFLSKTPEKKVKIPVGIRPKYRHGSGFNGALFVEEMTRYIKQNTGIELPLSRLAANELPAKFYEEVARNLGL